MRMLWRQRQGFGQLRVRLRQDRGGIGYEEKRGRVPIGARRVNQRVDIVGVGGESPIEKAARLSYGATRPTLVEPGQTLKIEIHRVGARRLLRASRLGGGELGVQRVRQARDDFVLHVEEIG